MKIFREEFARTLEDYDSTQEVLLMYLPVEKFYTDEDLYESCKGLPSGSPDRLYHSKWCDDVELAFRYDTRKKTLTMESLYVSNSGEYISAESYKLEDCRVVVAGVEVAKPGSYIKLDVPLQAARDAEIEIYLPDGREVSRYLRRPKHRTVTRYEYLVSSDR